MRTDDKIIAATAAAGHELREPFELTDLEIHKITALVQHHASVGVTLES
jgi:hypothetical protein